MKYLMIFLEWIAFFVVMVAVIIGTVFACLAACAICPYLAMRQKIRSVI